MTLLELEALKEQELRLRTSFALHEYFENRGMDSHAYLIEAQFYMRELEQRDSKNIARRDYRLELSIMALIALEIIIAIFGIWLGFREGKEQIAATQAQTVALLQLQRSAIATAESLTLLQATTATMNEAIQTQLHLTSRMALEVSFDGLTVVNVTNKGRTAVVLYGHKFDGLAAVMDFARPLPPSGFLQIQAPEAIQWFGKIPAERATILIPFEVYVESDDGTQYIVKCNFIGQRQKNLGNLKIVSQTVSVTKAAWRKRRP